MMLFRARRWRLFRLIRTQVSWDQARHRPCFKWEATFNNGAFVRSGMSKWLIVALFRARVASP